MPRYSRAAGRFVSQFVNKSAAAVEWQAARCAGNRVKNRVWNAAVHAELKVAVKVVEK
jgi:hypothetical protein